MDDGCSRILANHRMLFVLSVIHHAFATACVHTATCTPCETWRPRDGVGHAEKRRSKECLPCSRSSGSFS
ncbi:uncharacterized protein BDW47DRAFT_102848 [Aspergillus candidus]|uniref:Secreted protein n=1 Tax=Aspergillus candidus TaxID=41067 RepID=A0A2I2FG84_ASPCN|nr:hypothetical protein BDW47DRAFT_102848 [Aspergillus candidus]PLB39645.1 hypothetical protein BDW47DRAFT_102848 [Aspergillus candidus]